MSTEKFVNVDDLPESIKEDYVKYVYKRVKGNEVNTVSHSSALLYLLDTEINTAIQNSATSNPLEFIKYKKLLNDKDFSILFGCKCENRNKIIDILEILMFDQDDKMSIWMNDNIHIVKSKVWEKLRKKGEL